MIIIIINMEMTACQTKPVLRPLQPVTYSNQLGSAHALLRIRLWYSWNHLAMVDLRKVNQVGLGTHDMQAIRQKSDANHEIA